MGRRICDTEEFENLSFEQQEAIDWVCHRSPRFMKIFYILIDHSEFIPLITSIEAYIYIQI